jgi:hypothetical protein
MWDNMLRQKTKPLKIKGLRGVLVLEAGLEPARAYAHRILSPACLPIPPLELIILTISNFPY